LKRNVLTRKEAYAPSEFQCSQGRKAAIKFDKSRLFVGKRIVSSYRGGDLLDDIYYVTLKEQV